MNIFERAFGQSGGKSKKEAEPTREEMEADLLSWASRVWQLKAQSEERAQDSLQAAETVNRLKQSRLKLIDLELKLGINTGVADEAASYEEIQSKFNELKQRLEVKNK